ncbi:hypothetical protein [Enhydrobacter sp.]|jgi:ABC-type glycerol-3-phosphate transport system substrate-binding protein|uniref:hypothetical protein n=1 Tax=Enhydrobacter sp. TaxID=1894999 RepID=UPI00262BCBCB|nr:hypothetical protein [Enhydrobacter sp.]WIM14504.1 MAG: hypothetical protein OJF58_005474 [Enhydrobacter sp.]
MRPGRLLFALLGLLVLAACSATGQQQAAVGTIQLPGERPAPDLGLNVPPDAWSGPGRPSR